MDLTGQYQNQYQWRDWRTLYDALPLQPGQLVLDIGCAIGDQAADLAARGARVIGLDVNPEFIQAATSRMIPNATFLLGDIRNIRELDLSKFDGIWSSFSAAYLLNFDKVLKTLSEWLKDGGWIAVVEVDDLFGHGPLNQAYRTIIEDYYRDSLEKNRYDFCMGRKISRCLKEAGFVVEREFLLEDRELSFHGKAEAPVLEAWKNRLERMKLLQEFFGSEYDGFCREFLQCLNHPQHRPLAKVHAAVAIKPMSF